MVIACFLVYLIRRPRFMTAGLIPLVTMVDETQALTPQVCNTLAIMDFSVWVISLIVVVSYLVVRIRARKLIIPFLAFLIPSANAHEFRDMKFPLVQGAVPVMGCLLILIVIGYFLCENPDKRLRESYSPDDYASLLEFWFARFDCYWFSGVSGVPNRDGFFVLWCRVRWHQRPWKSMLIKECKLLLFLPVRMNIARMEFSSRVEQLLDCPKLISTFSGSFPEMVYILEKYKPTHCAVHSLFDQKQLAKLVKYFPSVHFIQESNSYAPSFLTVPPALPSMVGKSWQQVVSLSNNLMPESLAVISATAPDCCIYGKTLSSNETIYQARTYNPWSCVCPRCKTY